MKCKYSKLIYSVDERDEGKIKIIEGMLSLIGSFLFIYNSLWNLKI